MPKHQQPFPSLDGEDVAILTDWLADPELQTSLAEDKPIANRAMAQSVLKAGLLSAEIRWVQSALSAGADPNYHYAELQATALNLAVDYGSEQGPSIVQCLMRAGGDANAPACAAMGESDGSPTPFMMACGSGDEALVLGMLEEGSMNLLCRNSRGSSPSRFCRAEKTRLTFCTPIKPCASLLMRLKTSFRQQPRLFADEHHGVFNRPGKMT